MPSESVICDGYVSLRNIVFNSSWQKLLSPEALNVKSSDTVEESVGVWKFVLLNLGIALGTEDQYSLCAAEAR